MVMAVGVISNVDWVCYFYCYSIRNTSSEYKIMTVFEKEEMFDYLENLRESGATNMFGAAPYLKDAFDISISEAKQILLEWMENHGSI